MRLKNEFDDEESRTWGALLLHLELCINSNDLLLCNKPLLILHDSGVWNPQLNSSYLGSLEQLQSNAGAAGDIWRLLYSSVWCLVSKITGMVEMVGCWASISLFKQLPCKTSLSPLSMAGPWWSDLSMWLASPRMSIPKNSNGSCKFSS